MEILYVIEAHTAKVGDLIQFEAYVDEERYVELMFITSVSETDDGSGIIIRGDSEVTGDRVTHVLDPFLEIEIMGA